MTSLQYMIKQPVVCIIFLTATNADWYKQSINDSNATSGIAIGEIMNNSGKVSNQVCTVLSEFTQFLHSGKIQCI